MSEFVDVIRAHLASVKAANDKPAADPVGGRLSRMVGEEQRLFDQLNETNTDIASIRVFIAELERDIERRIESREATKTELLAVSAEIRVIRERSITEAEG